MSKTILRKKKETPPEPSPIKITPRPIPLATGARSDKRVRTHSKIAPKKKPEGKFTTPVKKPHIIPDKYTLFAICPGGLDEVLAKEVEALPAKITATYPGGVEFEGPLETAYLANLKLRSASRVLLLIKKFKKIFKPEELYKAIREIEWDHVFEPTSTLAIYVTESQTKERRIPIKPQFWALKAKDAICDHFTDQDKNRPDIDREDPDITIRLHLHDQILKVYLDLSGASLHERGYRREALEAPLKENLAAGLLLLAGWDKLCKEKYAFYDPFCGSGTLLIEAVLIATNTAPGLFRSRFGFFSWLDHNPELFEKVYEGLKAKRILDPAKLPPMMGSDQSKEATLVAKKNIEFAKLEEFVQLKQATFEETKPEFKQGIIVSNPPYGVRIGEVAELKGTYQRMGSTFKHHYKSWKACVITSDKTLMHAIGLKPAKHWKLQNGALDSEFSLFNLY